MIGNAEEGGVRGMLLMVLEDIDKGCSVEDLREKYMRMHKTLCDRHVRRLKERVFG